MPTTAVCLDKQKIPLVDQAKSLTPASLNRIIGEVVSVRIMVGGLKPLSGGRSRFFAADALGTMRAGTIYKDKESLKPGHCLELRESSRNSQG